MIEIQIAGAGAGKTFGLADKITNHINNYKGHKKIFVLTYTNSATTKIQQEIIKKIRNIPSILHIQTVHSFLLNEIVYPYSSYILDDVYNNISIMKISTSRFKNLIFKELKKNKIIHADNVYRISKKIIDKKNHTKLKKEKIRKIISILSDCFEKIYIDEVQDLNMDALSFLKF
ncbi:UvrD-helicase domain-containing protein [Arsenophonus nasoniae]|uniref:AAA family ATPase n=1 Tax=Arsenophonus nasoniae TaxID=638 RepID=A0AA95GEZ2_9GAMM|nr:UvrD-helicase domain-containing protein [Arsenophonus nasoniae]WGL95108.1 AAA family ATPase [Arsenophonus nasoniae]